jgi:DNA gyrase subunit A
MSNNTEKIFQVDVVEEMEQSYIDYSMSVITDRALPDVRDGMKPVHRRILYSMYELGLVNNKGFKKSARIVGDVIGKYHPHGDTSVYDAMVRLAQTFSLRYPIVEGQGNFGTIDGDPAAAMRYTEAKMSKIAAEMLRDLKKDTVDFRPNFSEDETEPEVLPARMPNLLLNGTTGIAVGMACSFAPHHLGSTIDAILKYIENEQVTTPELFETLGGPDFPTGGVIINKNELLEGYKTGKGRVRMRGKYHVEQEGKRNPKDLVVFTELPYAVNKERLVETIAGLCEEKKIEGITDIRDESDKDGIRLVFEVKRDVNADVMANILFKKTQLETTFSLNHTCLVDGEPKVLSLYDIIANYVAHQQEVILRRAKFELEKIDARIHILEGYLKALTDIDNVIAIIKGSRNSGEAREKLEAKYGFTQIQSKAILEMRLSKLTGLEKVEIENELAALDTERTELNSIINDKSKLNEVLTAELLEIKAKYNDDRRTEITQVIVKKEEVDIQFVQPEDVVVVITQAGNVKKIAAKSFKVQNRNGKGIKNQDDIIMDIISTNTIDTLMIFSSLGKVYRLIVDQVPTGTNASRGVSIKTLVKMEDHENPIAITSLYRQTSAKYVVFVTGQGMIKKTKLGEYLSTKRSGILGLKLKEDDAIAGITFIDNEQMLIVTEKGMSIRFGTEAIGAVGRAALGVIAIGLTEGDKVVAALPINKETDEVAIFTKYGLAKKTPLSEYPIQGRAGKGTITYKPTDSTGAVAAVALVDDTDNILVVGDKTSICVSSKEIPKLAKAAQGNVMIKGNDIISITKI